MLKQTVIIVLLLSTVHNEKFNWIQQLVNNVEHETRSASEIIILHSENKTTEKLKIVDVLFGTLLKFSSRILNFESESPENHISKLAQILGDPKTAFFVLLHYQTGDENFSQLSESINFVSNISETRSRPKLLIISFEIGNSVKYEKFLHRMWSLDFLDVTVVSILTEKKFYKNDYELSAVYHYNPHTNKTTRTRQLRTKWFPDKTLNLEKYSITVALQNYPPQIMWPNLTLKENQISGIGWLKLLALSESMNFQIKIFHKDVSNESNLDCADKYNSTGLYYNLIHRKVEFIGMEFQRIPTCDDKFYEWGVGILEDNLILVVPILSKQSYVLNDKWAIFRILLMSSLPFVIWLCVHLSGNCSENLQIIYLIQITLGLTVPRMPQECKEKIVIAVLLIICTLYNSMIFTTLTDVGLAKKTTYAIETIEDILSLNFSIVVNVNVAQLLQKVLCVRGQLLLTNILKGHFHPHTLINKVVTQKNTTCIGFSLYTKFLLQDKKDRCDMPIARILESDSIGKTVSGTIMAARSPYVKRVNDLLLRAIQSGIAVKWKSSFEKKVATHKVLDFTCFNRSVELQEIFWKLFFVLIVGYSLSIITFLIEMFILYRMKYVASNFKVAKYLKLSSWRQKYWK